MAKSRSRMLAATAALALIGTGWTGTVWAGKENETPPPAPAAIRLPVSPAPVGSQAAAVQQAVIEAIEALLGQVEDPPRIELAAPISASQRDGGVVLTFEQLRLIDGETTATIGDVVLTVTPRPERLYAFRLQLAPRMELSAGGRAVAALTIGQHSLAGVWSADHASLPELDATLGQIAVKSLDEKQPGQFALGALTAHSKLVKGSDGLWSGPSAYELSDLAVISPDGTFKIARIKASGSVADWDLDAFARLQQEFGFAPGRAALPSPAQGARLITALGDTRWGSASGELAASGIEFATGGQPQYRLGALTWHFGLDAAKSPANFSLGFSTRDLMIKQPWLPRELVPQQTGFVLTLDRFPLRGLIRALAPLVEQQQPDPDLAALTQVMAEARPRLSLAALNFAAQAFKLDGKGQLDFDHGATNLVAGAFDLSIRDLDKAMALAKSKKSGASEALPMLVMLQGMGKPVQAKDGLVYTYRIEIPQQGTVTVNGIPLDQLGGGN